MERLPIEVQTLYAELMERLASFEAHSTIGRVPGTFVTKSVKGEAYVYFQHSLPGGKRQVYLGRRTPELQRVTERFLAERSDLAQEREGIARLCSLLRASGAMATDATTARVLRTLADAGVFRLDGVLVGTQAFLALGNLLGVRWRSHAIRTHDIDLAGAAKLGVVLPETKADIPGALESLNMGFLPVPSFDPRHPSTSFKVRGKSLRLDLLTPQKGGAATRPVPIGRFGASAQPLPFLDYLIWRSVSAAVVEGGGILVRVPTPARFAFHKLLVSGQRPVTEHTKRAKDLAQAAELFAVLVEDRPGDLSLAWDEARGRGPGWVKRIRAAVRGLAEVDGDVAARVGEIVGR